MKQIFGITALCLALVGCVAAPYGNGYSYVQGPIMTVQAEEPPAPQAYCPPPVVYPPQPVCVTPAPQYCPPPVVVQKYKYKYKHYDYRQYQRPRYVPPRYVPFDYGRKVEHRSHSVARPRSPIQKHYFGGFSHSGKSHFGSNWSHGRSGGRDDSHRNRGGSSGSRSGSGRGGRDDHGRRGGSGGHSGHR